MPKLQDRTIRVALEAGIQVAPGVAPTWLLRPGRTECGPLWPVLRAIYSALTSGLELPDVMPARERRAVDGIVTDVDGMKRILEIDETQHFNVFRLRALDLYPPDIKLAFPVDEWKTVSQHKTRLEGGGFARRRPPLFDLENGRHRQRAFRDAIADLLPPLYGWGSTVRIAYFELEPWIWQPNATSEFARRFASRFGIDAQAPFPGAPTFVDATRDISEVSSSHLLTQPITPVDLANGRIRIPAATKPIFPSFRTTITATVRGVRIEVPYDPRNGPDRSRSGVLRIGRSHLMSLVTAHERLDVSKRGEAFILD